MRAEDDRRIELPKQQGSIKALTGSSSVSLIRKPSSEILFSGSPLNLNGQAPLFGVLQLVHTACQIG